VHEVGLGEAASYVVSSTEMSLIEICTSFFEFPNVDKLMYRHFLNLLIKEYLEN